MADQGGTSERVFSITLPVYPAGTVLRYCVQAMAGDNVGALAFDPPGAEHDVYTHLVTYPYGASSSIVINELMAKNQSTIADPQGEYDGWIELKNVSGQTVDLSGMCLSDNPRNPLKWQFPEGTLLGPGEYLLVWADEDGGDEPGLHANFELSSSGETIWLWDTAPSGFALLDWATFVDLASDQSLGRSPDGAGPMQIRPVPSPGLPNVGPGAAAPDFQASLP
jgi:hypothetical protein